MASDVHVGKTHEDKLIVNSRLSFQMVSSLLHLSIQYFSTVLPSIPSTSAMLREHDLVLRRPPLNHNSSDLSRLYTC
jgi:hypothetical protein